MLPTAILAVRASFAVLAALAGTGVGPVLPAAAERAPAPELRAGAWINSEPLKMTELRGRVVLVEFWTFACWNCQNVEPHVKAWHDRYAEQGLVVVGVHTPELPWERDLGNVRRYVAENDIHYPVAVDNEFATWRAYGNRYWPTIYLVDKRGDLRYRKIGEGDYAQTENAIRRLLSEPGPNRPAGSHPGSGGGRGIAVAAGPPEDERERASIGLLGDSPVDWERHWTEQRFGGREPTRYAVGGESGGLVLRGHSAASASAVWRALDLDDLEPGRLSWRWKVERSLPGNDDERVASGDDYAARVFVFFGPGAFSSRTRALCYVWASHEPVGSVYPSPYAERVSTFVLESGDARAGEWVSETRSVVADYRRAFGSEPPEVGGVAFMVDSDDTGLEATAWLDRMAFEADTASPPKEKR